MVIYSLKNLDNKSINEVGKTAKLFNDISKIVKINDGFVINNDIFNFFIENSNIKSKIINLLNLISKEDLEKTKHISNEIQKLIVTQNLPPEVYEAIIEAYNALSIDENLPLNEMLSSNSKIIVDIISSTRNNNINEIKINKINNSKDLINAIISCYAYYFSVENIFNINIESLGIAIIIKKNINHDISGSFFIKSKNNNNYLFINLVLGLNINEIIEFSDTYIIEINTLKIIKNNIKNQKIAFYFDEINHNILKKELDNSNYFSKIEENKIINYVDYFKEVLELNNNTVYYFFIKDNQLYIDYFEEKKEEHTNLFNKTFNDENTINMSNKEDISINNETKQDLDYNHFEDNKDIFSLYKSKENVSDEIISLNKDINREDFDNSLNYKYNPTNNELINYDNMLFSAKYSLGLCVLNCFNAIIKKLQEKNHEIYNRIENDFDVLIENIEKESQIPYFEELKKINKIKSDFILENKIPNLNDVDFVLYYTNKFFDEFF
jgi:hypothetical protein